MALTYESCEMDRLTALHTLNAHHVQLLERSIEERKRQLERAKNRYQDNLKVLEQLRADISSEHDALEALNSTLYQREAHLKDLKAQLFACEKQHECQRIEADESEQEYEYALQECLDRQREQRETVAMSLQTNTESLKSAQTRITALETQLKELRQRPGVRQTEEKKGYSTVVLAGAVGLMWGVALQMVRNVQMAVV